MYRAAVPLSAVAMANSLHVTFSPGHTVSERVAAFSAQLHDALVACGVTVLPHEQALADPVTGKLREGIVVIAPGELESGNLPVDHVTNLRRATIVGIVDGPCPADLATASQEKLNSIVKMLAWNIVQVVIYVDDADVDRLHDERCDHSLQHEDASRRGVQRSCTQACGACCSTPRK